MIDIKTSSGKWEKFTAQIEQFLAADTIELTVEGEKVHGYRSPDSPALWIRDHSDILRGGKYFAQDMKSAVEVFAQTQAANGRIFDFIITTPEKKEAENWEKWVRVQVEADVEYRFVKAAFTAWQAAGDDEWLAGLLPNLEKALAYSMAHPWRWDEQYGLIKRPYTIDTWDFDYTAGRTKWLNFRITPDTFWGIFHGDNSGFYEAANLLAVMFRSVGESVRADYWSCVAEELRRRANQLLFNGRFYTHFYKLTPVKIDGVDEAEQLSLSTPMAINRGMATHEMAVAILQEYRQRKKNSSAFAEWFGIDPPFPDGIFGDEKLIGGAYINGGIFPLTGGELSRAAFEHGFEEYGLQTLEQYRTMIGETGETYLWYLPDGSPATEENSTSPEATPTDGWGSSAMLHAFLEGLCGIRDTEHSFRKVVCSPRWAVTDENEVEINISYAASEAYFGYQFSRRENGSEMRLKIRANNPEVDFHILMPQNFIPEAVFLQGRKKEFRLKQIEDSIYVDFFTQVSGGAEIVIKAKK